MNKTQAAVLGIDVGTTAVKAMLVSEAGEVMVEEQVEQAVSVPQATWSEQDPRLWWASTKTAVAKAMAQVRQLPISLSVQAIGLSGQMHSSVFLDSAGEVVRPALLWSDGRTSSQCRDITESIGTSGLRKTVGNLALEGFTAPKVLWLRQNEPRNYEKVAGLLLAKDYIRFLMTGEMATDPSDAAGTLLFDVRRRRWSGEMLDAVGLSGSTLPRVVGSAEVSGVTLPRAAKELGLRAGIPVVGGGADNAAGAVGSGVINIGLVQSSIGTSGTVVTPVDQPRIDRRMRLHTFCHCVPNQWYLMGVILSAGNSLRWLRRVLLSANASASYEGLISEAARMRPGSDGLFFLPHLTGERTPHNDSNARGVFFGLHLGHERAHLVRAVMEGVCFALRDSLELMSALKAPLRDVRAIGGGARSRLWRQMQADIFGLPVSTVVSAAGPAYGAALLGAVGAGMFQTIGEGVGRWVKVVETVDPDPQRSRLYASLYAAYTELYPALKNRFLETATLAKRLSASAL